MQSLNRSIQKLPENRYPVKILQFGNGIFLRGFADWMIQVANEKAGFNAGISVVHGTPGSNVLSPADTAYTVVLKGIREEEFITQRYKVDIINRVVDPYGDFESFLDEALNTDLQFIISNIQEGGSIFSVQDASVAAVASTFPGKLTQLLYNRFKNQLDNSILVLPTEPHERNGTKLRQEVQQYCTHWSLPAKFTTWLSMHITFCNTLVDRIVSGFPGKERGGMIAEVASNDELIVEGEWFHQWVIEGPRWIEEVLPLKKAGLNVIYTDNLAPYHFRKIRILAAAQTILACAGSIAGLQTIREAIGHPVIGRYIKRLIYDDIIPVIPGDIMELERYAEEVIDRLRNPAIDHRLDSFVENIFTKFNSAILPTLIAHVDKNGFVSTRLAYAIAMLIFLYRPSATDLKTGGFGEFGEFTRTVWSGGSDSVNDMVERSRKMLNSKWWEDSLKNLPNLAEQTGQCLYSIAQHGILESLKK